MKKNAFKWISLCLVCLIALSNAGCMCTYLTYQGLENALKTPGPTAEPAPLDYGTADAGRTDVAFSSMTYTRPDLDELSDEIGDLLYDLDKGKDPKDLLERYDYVRSLYENADSELSFAYVLHALDVTNTKMQDEYSDLYERLTKIDLDMTELSIAMLDSEAYGDEVRAEWGDDYADTVIEDEKLNSEEIQPFLSEEQKLVLQYDELLNGYRLTDNGKSWTLEAMGEAYLAGDIDYETYVSLFDRFNAGLNEKAGALYLKMLKVRNQIASTQGYGDYAAYCYDQYSRDYTPADARALHKAVKATIVPLYQEFMTTDTSMYTMSDQTFSLEGYLASLQYAVQDFSPEMFEILNYMLRNHLYDFDDTEEKMAGSFTTYFSNYATPFILSHWTGSSQNVRTVMHEFGHFCRYYQGQSAGWSVTDPLDLAEVDSQGFELLMSSYDNRFFGANVNAATGELLGDAMYAVVTGCMEDEFQQEIYRNPAITLDGINALYLRLAEEYGLADLYGYAGTEWVQIPHTFQSPMYYISYAVSMILSLELWEEGQTDFDAARADYLTILKRPAYAEFRKTALDNGLSDPLSAETVEGIEKVLRARLMED